RDRRLAGLLPPSGHSDQGGDIGAGPVPEAGAAGRVGVIHGHGVAAGSRRSAGPGQLGERSSPPATLKAPDICTSGSCWPSVTTLLVTAKLGTTGRRANGSFMLTAFLVFQAALRGQPSAFCFGYPVTSSAAPGRP